MILRFPSLGRIETSLKVLVFAPQSTVRTPAAPVHHCRMRMHHTLRMRTHARLRMHTQERLLNLDPSKCAPQIVVEVNNAILRLLGPIQILPLIEK